MPYKEKKIEKLYFTIGEVAEMFNVSTSLVRYWEKEFDILKPKKNTKGTRYFTRKDIENLKLIYEMLKVKGYTLEGAKKQLRKNPKKVIDSFELKESLENIRDFLKELRGNL
ncbi:MAG: MerR family transcriptional regulator [Chitinophagaceae bacterium]|nr:MAG: MerR family transcriptional regulator [Chitinophagaceae bacterium]